jgi:hypothetical protein
MSAEEFNNFRLIGGTALGLYRGHRESIDIDLFSDSQYGSIDFDAIDKFLRKTFSYVDRTEYEVGPGRSYYVGNNKTECVKLDLFYTETFIREVEIIDGIRLATIEEIIAMKIEVISHSGRKKDFWDLHELIDDYSFEKMISFHEERYPYGHDRQSIIENFSDFEKADNDFDPICLRGKYWELIKLDLTDFAGNPAQT